MQREFLPGDEPGLQDGNGHPERCGYAMKQVRPVGAAELAEEREPETACSEKECGGKVKVRLAKKAWGRCNVRPFWSLVAQKLNTTNGH